MKKPSVVCNTVIMPASLTSMAIIPLSEIEQCSIRLLAPARLNLAEEKET